MELFDFADNGWTAGNRQLMKVADQVNRRFPDWRELIWVK
jgi:hypothetical protein